MFAQEACMFSKSNIKTRFACGIHHWHRSSVFMLRDGLHFSSSNIKQVEVN